jgi:hypothetical protein
MIGKSLGQVILKAHGLLTINIIAVGIAPGYDGYLLGFADPLQAVFSCSGATVQCEKGYDREEEYTGFVT